MSKIGKLSTALSLLLAAAITTGAPASAQQNPVTAIDVLLLPDHRMIRHASDANARLRKVFPKGFALDATHHPHITTLQQFVRTADLDKVYAAVGNVLASEPITTWKLKAFKYYYILRVRLASQALSSNRRTICAGCNKK